ncbi:MAG: hypothetical protein JJT78_11595 [Leptospira sp.]|nr:hypothetical protein [Leptospira sp.]
MDKILNGSEDTGISFWSMFLKKVLSKSGQNSGRIWSIQMKSNKILYFHIFYKFRLIQLDAKYVKNLDGLSSNKKILLDIDPIYLYRGRFVFDEDGKKLGKISRLEQLGFYNDFDAILVKKKFYLPGKRFDKKQIKVFQKNIILKSGDASWT